MILARLQFYDWVETDHQIKSNTKSFVFNRTRLDVQRLTLYRD